MSQSVKSLLGEAVEGDTNALRILLKRHGPAARCAIQGRIPRKWRSLLEDDDVMQVTYLEAFLHLDQFEADDEAAFIAWLTRIAQNALRDALRGLERQKRGGPDIRAARPFGYDSSFALIEHLVGNPSSPSRHAARQELAGILSDAIDMLPPDYSRVVRMCDLEGRAVHDVAVDMGCSVGAVHMRRARAHSRLQTLLGSESQFFSDLA